MCTCKYAVSSEYCSASYSGKMNIPKVIAHSHSSSCPGFIRKTMDWWNRPKIARYATERVACGEMAGRWLFGDKAYQSGQVILVNNAIQAEKSAFRQKSGMYFAKRWAGKIR